MPEIKMYKIKKMRLSPPPTDQTYGQKWKSFVRELTHVILLIGTGVGDISRRGRGD